MGIIPHLEISPEQGKILAQLLHHHLPGITIWAYGSRVNGKARPQSDLDLVAFASPQQKKEISALKEAFEESSLPFRVDLFIWEDFPEEFRIEIERVHISIQ